MRFAKILLLSGMFLLIIPVAQAAETTGFFVEFDTQTMERGYTVCSGDKTLCVPILPKQFKHKLSVKISAPEILSVLPEDKSKRSNIYLLDIKPEYSGMLKAPVTVQFKVDQLNSETQIYFFDSCRNKWRPLDSQLDYKNGTISAKLAFPFVQIAVFGPKEKMTDEFGLTAEAALVINKKTGETVFTKNAKEVLPIASLTKLTTVLTFLDYNPGWDKQVVMEKSDFVGGATLWVKSGDMVTVRDLFYSTLVGSKNNAVMALIRSTGLSTAEFVAKMNQKVAALGLKKTYFVEPTGLDARNVSTAEDLAVVARETFKNVDVVDASTTQWYKVKPVNSDLSYWVKNTSMKMFESDLVVTGTKTGWTDEAGYCLVTQAKKDNHEFLALVMGAAMTKNYEEVYSLLKKNL